MIMLSKEKIEIAPENSLPIKGSQPRQLEEEKQDAIQGGSLKGKRQDKYFRKNESRNQRDSTKA
jgi:hypothetical protein